MGDIMGYLLGAVRLCLFALMVVSGLLISSLMFPLLGWSKRRRMINRWSRLLLRALGVRMVIDRPPPQANLSGMLVSNHSSWLDIFVTNAVQAVRFVSKSEVRDWPVLGVLVTSVGTLYVERGNRSKIGETNDAIAQAAMNGDLVGLYPEGTTSDGTYLLPFKTNLLQPAIEHAIDVYPIAVLYRCRGEPTRLTSYEGDTSFGESLWQLVRARGVEAHICFGDVLNGGQFASRYVLTEALQTSIEGLTGLSVRQPDGVQEALLRGVRQD